MNWIYAHWWMGNNFGDVLTPYIIEKLSGKRAVWAWPDSLRTTYAVTGSIMTSNSIAHCIVWGCGVIDEQNTIMRPIKTCAVRGKVTRARMQACGHDCPDIYGDPALILPVIYRPSVKSKRPLGIIPHWEDLATAYAIYGDDPQIMIINVTDPVERVIDDINRCNNIMSSSLHGLVVADAYGIPNQWIYLRDPPDYWNVKFRDYWSGIGVIPQIPIDIRNKMSVGELIKKTPERPNSYNIDDLVKSCPFL